MPIKIKISKYKESLAQTKDSWGVYFFLNSKLSKAQMQLDEVHKLLNILILVN